MRPLGNKLQSRVNDDFDDTMRDNTIEAFFALLRAGLWSDVNQEIRIDGTTDWNEVYQLAQEQSVQGLVLQGIETAQGSWLKVHGLPLVPKILLLQWIGEVQVIEQRNKEMNLFIAELLESMRKMGIYTLLVKGQGIAQCYEKPQWRTPGDIDFFLSDTNYEKAKSFLKPLANDGKPERLYSKEIGFYVNSWLIELHGTLHTGLSTRVDKSIDAVQRDVFYAGNVRSWYNGNTQVFLPAADEDVFLVFTHFVKHFYKEGGVTLRQMCDWCRLLYRYRGELDLRILESRIKRAGLMSEWKAFGELAVNYLGMPMEAMPLYSKDEKWSRKAEKIVDFILKGGEWRKFQDTYRVGQIFPMSTLRFLPGIILNVNWLKIKERVFKR